MTTRRLLASFLTVLLSLPAYSQSTTIRPVSSLYTIEAGSSHIANTYLTPIAHNGWSVAVGYERRQAMAFAPERWAMGWAVRLEADRATGPAGNAPIWYGGLDGQWQMMRSYRLPATQPLTVGIGPEIRVTAGASYASRNGNNPVAVTAGITARITGHITWHTKLFNRQLSLQYRPSISALGAFFSPAYGELFYEIYLGNHSGLAHCAWPGNYFDMTNRLSADIRLGSTTLRIGYRNGILTTRVNHITTHHITHSAVIGFGSSWLSAWNLPHISRETRIVTSAY